MKIIELNKKWGSSGHVTKVDDEDFEYLNQWNWSINISKKSGLCYVSRHEVSRDGYHTAILMHRFILQAKIGEFVDHRDKNTLNNQKNNIRLCTQSQNCANRNGWKNSSSKYLGVYFNKNRNIWESGIQVNKKKIYIGRFDNEISAAKAYDINAMKYFGEFANLNFNY